MNIPPIMILALALVIGIALYALIKRSWSAPAKPGKTSPSAKKTGGTPADDPDKTAALDKFKAAHAAARDKRKQLQKTVAEDPDRATKTIRSMMKR